MLVWRAELSGSPIASGVLVLLLLLLVPVLELLLHAKKLLPPLGMAGLERIPPARSRRPVAAHRKRQVAAEATRKTS